jgi:dGTPase
LEATRRAEGWLADLFRLYLRDPGRLPARVVARLGEEGEARAVADYVAGMTDRFARAEHERLVA